MEIAIVVLLGCGLIIVIAIRRRRKKAKMTLVFKEGPTERATERSKEEKP